MEMQSILLVNKIDEMRRKYENKSLFSKEELIEIDKTIYWLEIAKIELIKLKNITNPSSINSEKLEEIKDYLDEYICTESDKMPGPYDNLDENYGYNYNTYDGYDGYDN
jgi:GTPase Era involved in 16S rRNA processing